MTLLTRQTFPLSGLQQDGPLSVQVSWLAALTQVGFRNVLPVDAHAVYVLPGTKMTPRFRNQLLPQTSALNLEHRMNRVPNGPWTSWRLPALVTADHVAVIMCEATDTAGDVGTIAAIL